MNRLLFILVINLASYGADAQNITAISYNIRFDNPADGEDAWPLRKEFLAAQIRFYHPDIFGIQEGLHRQVLYLQEALPAYRYIGAGRDDGREAGEYSALYYRSDRFDALRSGTFWLSPTPEQVSKGWDAALPRVCTWAWLKDRQSGDTLVALNTHFDHMGANARLESARLLLSFLRESVPEHLPVILMGDFNCSPDERPYAALTGTLLDAKTLSRQPHFGPEGTFNGFVFHKPVERRIDYIFVSKGIDVLQHATLSDNKECRYPSDHLPVLARMEIVREVEGGGEGGGG